MDLIFIGLGCWFLYFIGYLVVCWFKDEIRGQKRRVEHEKRVQEINAEALRKRAEGDKL